jgi:hypothetical protein
MVTTFKILEMRRSRIFILLGALALVFASCKPDAPLQFNSTDGVYFNAASDSVFYTFAKSPKKLIDTLKIPVSVLGKPNAQDRELTIVGTKGNGDNAIEGTHFKLLPPYTMPANAVSTLVPVVIYRTGDIDSIVPKFTLQLKENNSFGLGITAKTSVRVKLGYLQKPPTWGDPTGLPWAGYITNFGTWTKTKYQLVLDALYNPIADTTISEFPIGNRFAGQFPASYTQYLQIVKNYIRTKYPGNYSSPLGVGATLRDPDISGNPIIQVGPANY